MKSVTKVIYKPDSQSTDEYMVIVNPDEYKRWKGDRTIPLIEVVDSFDVFHTGQGAQGKMGRASKAQLDNIFGTTKEDEIVTIVLEKGRLESASAGAKFGDQNNNRGSMATSGSAQMHG